MSVGSGGRGEGRCVCGAPLSQRDRTGSCPACLLAAGVDAGAPDLPASFWNEPALREAFANRHMGRVIRAWRTHRLHPRPVPQEQVAEWAAMTQPQLSRIETGPPIKNLDRLTHFATLLRIPPRLLWFDLPPPAPGRAMRPGFDGGRAGAGARSNAFAGPVAVGGGRARSTGRSGSPGRHPTSADPTRLHPELRAPIEPGELASALRRRLLQVALDVSDLDEAIRLAEVAAEHADLIEVGDPLLKPYGMQAVREIRQVVPDAPLVVEFSSSDWVEQQIALAADAGADLVLVMGVDQPSRIERAVHAARTNRVGILLALPTQVDLARWCSTVENAGADGISIIRNIDSAESATTIGSRLRRVAALATIPLAISGGFTPHNVVEVQDDRWSILIVGGAFVRARQPAEVLRSLRHTVTGEA